MALIYAYYLEKILDEIDDRTTLYQYTRKITTHFLQISRNTYEIFRDFPTLIESTKTISIQTMRRLKRAEIELIKSQMFEFLVGAQNLEEENLLP